MALYNSHLNCSYKTIWCYLIFFCISLPVLHAEYGMTTEKKATAPLMQGNFRNPFLDKQNLDNAFLANTTASANQVAESPEKLSKLESSYNLIITKLLLNNDNTTEEEANSLDQQKIHEPIRQIGYSLFSVTKNNPPQPQAGNRNFSSETMLLPGDEINVQSSGSVDLNLTAFVDSEYNIFFPKIGIIQLKDLSISKGRELITSRFEDYYKGSHAYVQLYSQAISSVFASGQVNQPGIIAIPSNTSLVGALHMADGITMNGSLRNIMIHRQGELIRRDLYGLIISGDWAPLPLQGGDLITVPSIGSTVAVIGEVLQEGIYEIADGETLASILELAQGFSPMARSQTITVYRQQEKSILYKPLSIAREQSHKFILQNRDIIQLATQEHQLSDYYTINGAIAQPGRYQLNRKTNLAFAINQAGGLLQGNETTILIKRRNTTALSADYTRVNIVQDYIGITLSITAEQLKESIVMNEDEITILDDNPLGYSPKVYIYGDVEIEGAQDYIQDMSLLYLTNSCGGVKKSANLSHIVISRKTDGLLQEILVDATAENLSQIKLNPEDTVTIPSTPSSTIVVMATGEFNHPGTYRLPKNSTIQDLITVAGNVHPHAFIDGAAFYRTSVAKSFDEQMKNIVDRLEEEILNYQMNYNDKSNNADAEEVFRSRSALLNRLRQSKSKGRIAIALSATSIRNVTTSTQANALFFQLEDGDHLHIPVQSSTVNVMGQIQNPNTVAFIPNKPYTDYISDAGGLTRFADNQRIYVIKANGSVQTISDGRNGKPWFKRIFINRSTGNIAITQGDTIFVPGDYTILTNKIGLTKDITQIMFNILSSAGLAISLF